jgi:hypothetical protein
MISVIIQVLSWIFNSGKGCNTRDFEILGKKNCGYLIGEGRSCPMQNVIYQIKSTFFLFGGPSVEGELYFLSKEATTSLSLLSLTKVSPHVPHPARRGDMQGVPVPLHALFSLKSK